MSIDIEPDNMFPRRVAGKPQGINFPIAYGSHRSYSYVAIRILLIQDELAAITGLGHHRDPGRERHTKTEISMDIIPIGNP